MASSPGALPSVTGKLSLRRSTIAPWRSEQIQSASAKRKRLGVRKRLIAHGLSEAAVDRWMEAWEASGRVPPTPNLHY